jgi:PAS domain S-box-containing protein
MILDDAYRLTYVNDEVCRISGYPREETIGQDFRKFLDEESKQLVADRYIRRQRGEEVPPRYEFNIVHKDGQKRRVEISSNVIKDSAGKVKTVAQILDITERKQAEQALERQKAYFQQLFDNSPEAIALLDNTDRVVQVNKGFEALFGYRIEEIKGRFINDVVVPEERIEEASALSRAALSNEVRRKETVRKRKDGSLVDVDTLGYPVRFGNKTVGVYAIYSDITERKRMEEELRRAKEQFQVLVEESPLGVSVIRKDGRYQYVNPKFVEMFGYTLEEVATGREWFAKAYPDPGYRNQVISTWNTDAKSAKCGEVKPQTFTVTCKNGSEKLIYFRPVTLETGDHFVIYEDITERKRMEEELRAAQEQLIRSERLVAIGQLAGGVGHELRNPLGAIKNAVYYIKGKVASSELGQREPRVLEFLGIIEDEVNSSNKIITDLLEFSRVRKPSVSPARIEKIIEDALSRIAILENIELIKKLDAGLPEINVDPDQIKQVLVNIITNAVQAMPEGGKLLIGAREKNKFLEVEVTDTGCGIPQESIDKIFDPLFTTKAKGIGLGLAVCKSIIDRHEGNIAVKSKVGEGTTFNIKLPLGRNIGGN